MVEDGFITLSFVGRPWANIVLFREEMLRVPFESCERPVVLRMMSVSSTADTCKY